jgi:hypothetical protein
MLNVCVQRFDVTGNLKNFVNFFELNSECSASLTTASPSEAIRRTVVLQWGRRARDPFTRVVESTTSLRGQEEAYSVLAKGLKLRGIAKVGPSALPQSRRKRKPSTGSK